jgi:hypothetical protein
LIDPRVTDVPIIVLTGHRRDDLLNEIGEGSDGIATLYAAIAARSDGDDCDRHEPLALRRLLLL